MDSKKHSILPPSSAAQWSECYGWVDLAQAFPELDASTDAAREGDASHQYAATYVLKGIGTPLATELKAGDLADNGTVLTEEIIEGAQMYIDDVLNIFSKYLCEGSNNCLYGVEVQLLIPRIHQECFGTPDAWLYDIPKNKLWLWDYKFGHVPVDVFWNKQLICYFAGVLDKLSLQFDQEVLNDLTVEFRVVQPRAYHNTDGPIRNWVVKAQSLDMALGKLVVAANRNLSLDPGKSFQTGTYCRYCTYRGVCPAALVGGLSLYETATQVSAMDLPSPALGLQQVIVTRALEQLKGLQTAYEELIKARIKLGQNVPYWNIIPTAGAFNWVKPFEEVALMGDLLDINLRKDKVATPAQAIKLGVDPTLIDQYAKRTNSSKLIQENSNKASFVFSTTEES